MFSEKSRACTRNLKPEQNSVSLFLCTLSCSSVSLPVALVSFILGLLCLTPGQRQAQVNPSKLEYRINLVNV